MNERPIPDLAIVSFAAAVWLVGLAMAFILQAPDSEAVSLAWRGILIGITLFGAFHMFRIGLKLRNSDENLTEAIRVSSRRVERKDRVA